MRIVEIPESNDILCGKDKTFNRNIGNITYRQMIVSTAMRYAQLTTKPEKMKITAQIVHTMIHHHKSRFLKQVMVRGGGGDYYWQEISTTAARDKTSHALRFCAAQMMQQSSPRENAVHSFRDDLFAAVSSTPITPPSRRDIFGRPQRSHSYRESHNVAIATSTTTKRTHRRTVSNEIAVPIAVTSSCVIDLRSEDVPVPLECKSAMTQNYQDDIEAILREPLRWEDAMGDDDDCYDDNCDADAYCAL